MRRAPICRGAHLSSASNGPADLTDANLAGARFPRAALTGAQLPFAGLEGGGFQRRRSDRHGSGPSPKLGAKRRPPDLLLPRRPHGPAGRPGRGGGFVRRHLERSESAGDSARPYRGRHAGKSNLSNVHAAGLYFDPGDRQRRLRRRSDDGLQDFRPCADPLRRPPPRGPALLQSSGHVRRIRSARDTRVRQPYASAKGGTADRRLRRGAARPPA